MNLAIICAGEMANELYNLILSDNELNYEKIFLVDIKENTNNNIIAEKKFFESEILSSEILIAAGEPFLRAKLYNKYKEHNAKFTKFKHKSSVVSNNALLGEGCIILPFVYIANNVKIGNNVLLHSGVKIENDSIIDENCFLNGNAFVGAKTNIERNCFIGPNAVLRDNITIGENSIIGMGSVVTKSTEKNSVYYGNPAVRNRDNDTRKVFR